MARRVQMLFLVVGGGRQELIQHRVTRAYLRVATTRAIRRMLAIEQFQEAGLIHDVQDHRLRGCNPRVYVLAFMKGLRPRWQTV